MKQIAGQSGFTIIEVTIGFALLSLAILVAVLAYTSIIRLQDKGVSIRNVQQDGRYAIEAMSRDIRNATSISVLPVPAGAGPNTVFTGNEIDLSSDLNLGQTIKYIYDAAGSRIEREYCSGTPVTCQSSYITSSNVRVTALNFTYYPDAEPFVRIYGKFEQPTPGLVPTDPYYQVYELNTTVTPRQE